MAKTVMIATTLTLMLMIVKKMMTFIEYENFYYSQKCSLQLFVSNLQFSESRLWSLQALRSWATDLME